MADSSPLTVTPSATSAINHQVLKVSPDTALTDVIRQMNNSAQTTRSSCACVIDEAETIIGIITERDIVRLTAKQTRASLLATTPVSAIMTTPVTTLEVGAFKDIFAVLFLFRRYRIRHLPITDQNNRLLGVVTPASIRKVLKPANLLKMRRVADIMTTKVIQAPANVPVIFLAQLMTMHRVSCVIITDIASIEEDGEPAINPPIGIVTERDIVQLQAAEHDLTQLTASEVMSTPLHLLDPQDSLWTAHQTMRSQKVRRLVVSWNWGRDIGIITQTSLLRVFDPIEMYSVIDSLQQTAKQLTTSSSSTPSEIRSKVESPAESSTDIPLRSLLKQISDLIETAAQSTQLSSLQKPQLQQAKHIIQHVTDTLPQENQLE